jgi:hypothetical protein
VSGRNNRIYASERSIIGDPAGGDVSNRTVLVGSVS